MHQNAPKGLTPPLFWTQRKRKNLFFLQLLHEKPSCLVILVHLALLPRRLGAKVQKNEISRVKLVILVPWGWPPFPVKQYQATTKTTFFLDVFSAPAPSNRGIRRPPCQNSSKLTGPQEHRAKTRGQRRMESSQNRGADRLPPPTPPPAHFVRSSAKRLQRNGAKL